MEERIIDDEYGRGIRLKKTKDGYVDVTDELAPEMEEEAMDEVAFEFPMLETDEDDEDLVGLSPEEAAVLRKRKEEAEEKRKADYERACAEGEELLQNQSFHAAELKYENALHLDGIATVASVGYWRAKTENFTNPDVLISEYADTGLDSMEYDLGLEAVDIIRRDFRAELEKREAELAEEEKPLAKAVEGKQALRREVLSARLKKSIIAFIASLLPLIAGVILTIVFALKIPTTRESTYILPTAVCAGVSVVLFIVFMVFANKLINAVRMYTKNERLSSTEEGEKLLQIRSYRELYESMLATPVVKTQATEETKETQE